MRRFYEQLFNWKTTGAALTLVLLGVAFVVIGVSVDGHWSTILATVGTAVVSTGLIAIVYEFILLNTLRKLVRQQFDESHREHNDNKRRLDRLGIITAYPRFNSNRFAEQIHNSTCPASTEVKILQSWIYSLDVFCRVVSECHSKDLPVTILVGHPESALVQRRYCETHPSSDLEFAQQMLSNQILNFMIRIQSENEGNNLERLGLKFGLYDFSPTMTLYAIGQECCVGWFPKQGFAVASPHIRCQQPPSSILNEFDAKPVSAMAMTHFEEVAKTAVFLEQGHIDKAEIPQLRA